MPNHFLTVGLASIDHGRLYDTLGDDVDIFDILEPLKKIDLCQEVMPRPKEFDGIISNSNPCRYRNKLTGEFWNEDCNGPYGNSDWERVNLTYEELNSLMKTYGATNWYDWCVNNWGTKWGTYQLNVHSMGGDGRPILIEFQTAWGPPKPYIMTLITDCLKKNYYIDNIMWMGHDPSDGSVELVELGNLTKKEVH